MSKTMKLQDYEAQAAFESASELPVPGTLASFLGAPARMLSTWREARRHRRAIVELSQLDDRMLRDIGVNRGEIPRVAMYGRELF